MIGRRQKTALGLIETPGGVLRRVPLERDIDALWGKPDDKGRPVWMTNVVRLFKGQGGRPSGFQILRDDRIEPIALPGEKPVTVTFAQKQSLIRRHFRGLRSGHMQAADTGTRLIHVTVVMTSIAVVFVLAGLGMFLPTVIENMRGMFG